MFWFSHILSLFYGLQTFTIPRSFMFCTFTNYLTKVVKVDLNQDVMLSFFWAFSSASLCSRCQGGCGPTFPCTCTSFWVRGGLGPGWSLLQFPRWLRLCSSLQPYLLLGWGSRCPAIAWACPGSQRGGDPAYSCTSKYSPGGSGWHPVCPSTHDPPRWGQPGHSRPLHLYLHLGWKQLVSSRYLHSFLFLLEAQASRSSHLPCLLEAQENQFSHLRLSRCHLHCHPHLQRRWLFPLEAQESQSSTSSCSLICFVAISSQAADPLNFELDSCAVNLLVGPLNSQVLQNM